MPEYSNLCTYSATSLGRSAKEIMKYLGIAHDPHDKIKCAAATLKDEILLVKIGNIDCKGIQISPQLPKTLYK